MAFCTYPKYSISVAINIKMDSVNEFQCKIEQTRSAFTYMKGKLCDTHLYFDLRIHLQEAIFLCLVVSFNPKGKFTIFRRTQASLFQKVIILRPDLYTKESMSGCHHVYHFTSINTPPSLRSNVDRTASRSFYRRKALFVVKH